MSNIKRGKSSENSKSSAIVDFFKSKGSFIQSWAQESFNSSTDRWILEWTSASTVVRDYWSRSWAATRTKNKEVRGSCKISKSRWSPTTTSKRSLRSPRRAAFLSMDLRSKIENSSDYFNTIWNYQTLGATYFGRSLVAIRTNSIHLYISFNKSRFPVKFISLSCTTFKTLSSLI